MNLPIHTEKEILSLIPQRTPFVMVDALLSFSKNTLTASFTLKENNILLKENTLSESGLIEHQAQSVALHTGYDYFLQNKKAPIGYIGSIKQTQIFDLPKIGDTIHTDVTILSEFAGVTLVKVSSKVGEKILANTEMKTVVKV